ncbi:MAG: hypothetical protein IKP28_02265 [Clostridia bacterium]|nr:hypothetical protein [Clostridia bacterium]
MATSTLGDDKAKYKEMLIHWLASVVILLILPYIMAFSMNLCRVTINVVKNISNNMAHNTADNSLIAQSGGANFEKTLVFGMADTNGRGFDGLLTRLQKSDSGNLLALTIVYCVLVYYQIKFFFMYMKRMLATRILGCNISINYYYLFSR